MKSEDLRVPEWRVWKRKLLEAGFLELKGMFKEPPGAWHRDQVRALLVHVQLL